MGVPQKKYVEDIPKVQGGVHANFGEDPSSSLGEEWQQTDRQTDRHTFLFYIKRFFLKTIGFGQFRGGTVKKILGVGGFLKSGLL